MRNLFTHLDNSATRTEVGRVALLRWLVWFAFLLATMAMLVGIKYPLAAGFPQTTDGQWFFLLLTFSHWHSLLFLLAVVLFVPLILVIPAQRFIRGLAILFAILGVCLLVVDVFSFSIYRFHLNGLVFSLLFDGAADEIFVFDIRVYLIALLAIGFIVATVVYLNSLAMRIAVRRKFSSLGYLLFSIMFLSLLGQHGWFAWANVSGNSDITSQARLYPLYMPTRADKEFYKLGWADKNTNTNTKKVSAKTGAVNYPHKPISCTETATEQDIFLIVIDSWRYDAMSEANTPNIHAFSKEAMQFERHYSGGNNTRTGIFSLFYGLPATYWESFLDVRAGSVWVNRMQDLGYKLSIYASAKLSSPEFDRTIFADVKNLRKETEAGSVLGRDKMATSEFVNSMAEGSDAPIFGLLFYDAPHSYAVDKKFKDHFQPAAAAMNYFALTNETDPEPLLNLYYNSVISVDEMVGQSFDAIKRAGRWENAIVIVTGDHGQEFNDNKRGYWGHNGNFTDAQIRVPMLIKWPGRGADSVAYTTTHYDLAPTIMQEVLGCENAASDYSVGQSLFNERQQQGFMVGGFGDFGVREDKRIHWVDKFGGVQVLSDKYEPLSQSPDPAVIKMAIEQNSTFLK